MKGKAVSIRVRGQVQGVGFRPFIWQLAREFGLCGRVWNDAEGVGIEAAGAGLDAFVAAITARAPPLARVDAVEVAPFAGDLPEGFEIAASRGRGAETRVTPDAATCPACAAEIRAPGRRQGYAFTNCTHCGPRFTILQGLPYDRAQTTMAAFPMCADCRAEYGDPADRRFHAQPVACPACGPRLWLEAGGAAHPGDPIAEAARRLRHGQILAIKGLGGFHLACDAANPAAIATLRARKRRPAKPFALMARAADLAAFCTPSQADLALLKDPAAPIVLLPARGTLPENLAPGMATLGVMLPYTPLHHLLLDAFAGPLVMTSGNLSGEPQVIGNDEARAKLAAFADAFLIHDRDIARRLDDSVERSDPPLILRRARGRVPGTLPLPPGFADAPPVLALGGQMKGAIALVKNGQALLGHHLGDLDDALCEAEFHKAIADYSALFDHRPALVAVDAHPAMSPPRPVMPWACRWPRSSTTTPTLPPAWPRISGPATAARWRGSCSTAPGLAPTARSGAESFSSATMPTRPASPILRPRPCPAATAPRANPGATRWPGWTGRGWPRPRPALPGQSARRAAVGHPGGRQRTALLIRRASLRCRRRRPGPLPRCPDL